MPMYTYKSKEKITDKIYKGQKRKFLDDTITIYKVNNEIYVGQETIAYILDVRNVSQISFIYETNFDHQATIKIPVNRLWQSWRSRRNSKMNEFKLTSYPKGYARITYKLGTKLTAVYEYLKKSRQNKTIKENKMRDLEKILNYREYGEQE